MNFITFDVSLNSTGVSIWNINGYRFLSYMKNNNKLTKWGKLLSDFITIKTTSYTKDIDYLENEYVKMCDYENNIDIIIKDIEQYLVEGEIYSAFEGYAYGAGGNSLLDIVAYSTLLRNKVKNYFNTKFEIYAPSTIKKECCGLAYGWVQKGKKKITYETRNVDGIAGGNFTKREMLQAIYDYPCDSKLSLFVKEYFSDLYPMASIPAPIPDLVDSFWLLKILMNDKIFQIKKINESI